MQTCNWEAVAPYKEGDVFVLHGKRVRLLKKTTTAISVESYPWYIRVADWLLKEKN